MMGATAIAVDTVNQSIAAHASQATAFQFVQQNYLHTPYGIPSGAGSSNDFLNAPGNIFPTKHPDSGGSFRFSDWNALPVQKDEVMLKVKPALKGRQGKSSKSTQPLEARIRRRIN